MALEAVRPVGGGITIIVICSIMIPFTLTFVILRFWARKMTRHSIEVNDYLVAVGAILAVGLAIVLITSVVYGGVGYPQHEVKHLAPTLAKLTFAIIVFWSLANAFVKLSIVHLYTTLFRNNRFFTFGIYFVLFLIVGLCVTNIVQNLLACRPVAFNWDKTIPHGKCDSLRAPYLVSAVINMAIDVILFSLPIPLLWNLRMDTRKKVSLLFIFGFGFFICIISAVRIQSIYTLDYKNITQSIIPDGIYTVLEPCLGTMNACFPILRPLVIKISESKLVTSLRGKLLTDGTYSTRRPQTNAVETIGGGGPKRFHRLDETDFHVERDEVYPLKPLNTMSPI